MSAGPVVVLAVDLGAAALTGGARFDDGDRTIVMVHAGLCARQRAMILTELLTDEEYQRITVPTRGWPVAAALSVG